MSSILTERTVGELVAERISRSRVFEEFGVDYCCGGGDTLTNACNSKGISLDDVVAALETDDSAESPKETHDYNTMKLDALIDHIVSTHHAYLIEELPRLVGLAEKVANAHADNDSRVVELEVEVRGLYEELMSHMGKEEQILFPVIRELAETGKVPFMPFGTLANPIRMMESEHDAAGGGLTRIRELTDNYAEPDWACNTYRALMDGLRTLELDLHQHIHKENNILFPKGLALEDQLQ